MSESENYFTYPPLVFLPFLANVLENCLERIDTNSTCICFHISNHPLDIQLYFRK